MTKHTDGAVRAAEKIKTLVVDVILHGRSNWSIVSQTANDKFAAIIDQETGLPKLKARNDHLEAERAVFLIGWKAFKAEKAELLEVVAEIEKQASEAVVVVSQVHGDDADHLCAIVTYIRNKARTARAKAEPEGGA